MIAEGVDWLFTGWTPLNEMFFPSVTSMTESMREAVKIIPQEIVDWDIDNGYGDPGETAVPDDSPITAQFSATNELRTAVPINIWNQIDGELVTTQNRESTKQSLVDEFVTTDNDTTSAIILSSACTSPHDYTDNRNQCHLLVENCKGEYLEDAIDKIGGTFLSGASGTCLELQIEVGILGVILWPVAVASVAATAYSTVAEESGWNSLYTSCKQIVSSSIQNHVTMWMQAKYLGCDTAHE